MSQTRFTVKPGESTTIDIAYSPSADGAFGFDLDVASNDADEATYDIRVTGTADGTVKRRTKRIIANFLRRRADQLASNEPDLTGRLGSGPGGAGTMTGDGSLTTNRFAFATSLRQMLGHQGAGKAQVRHELGRAMALRGYGATGGAAQPPNGFDVWISGRWSRVKNKATANDIGLLYVGADYRFGADLTVGLLGQFDWTDEKDRTLGYRIKGSGWMAGPYVAARLHDNLIFDARAAWGRSRNTVSPYATYSDDFDGGRWLVKGQFTGDFNYGSVRFAPHVGVLYLEESQKGYTDSRGNRIERQSVALGRLTFGPKLSATYRTAGGTSVAPYVSLKGIWDFRRSDLVDIETGVASAGNDALRGRAEAGLSVHLPNGMTLSGEGFYDGIGAGDYEAYGGNAKLSIPF
ncbi:MAG: autotransporter domain-containing protein [Hyphomicrobiaceae bacterium]